MQFYKYRSGVAIGALLGSLLDAAIPAPPDIDCIAFIPLSRERLAERGFNQALEIARPLAKARAIALRSDLATRVRHTGAQAELPFAARRKNVRGAFACLEDLSGLRIAVVDDVMTTGATLDEFAKTLKKRGAARVENWVVARTLPRNQ
jgi:ComF family protein